VCVLPDSFYGRWIQVEGDVEIVERPEAMELLIDYYRRISGDTPTGTSIDRRWWPSSG
jgi:hypothetical protein